MAKTMTRASLRKRKAVPSDIKNYLAKNNACYVLITCKEPSLDGKMQVEMNYEGDACLAAYLVESAQGRFEDNII